MRLSRRKFLRGSLALAEGTATTSFPRPYLARAQASWGELPDAIWGPNFQPKKILELFLPGGLSQWENFWVTKTADGQPNWRNFDEEMANGAWQCPPLQGVTGSATGLKQDEDGNDEAFSQDQLGNNVFWGPATAPLWRDDIFKRTRMFVLRHDLVPHELAAPTAVAGLQLGNPRYAGTGAAVQRRRSLLNPRNLPYAYCITTIRGTREHFRSASLATGLHSGNSRPVEIRLQTTGSADLVPLLNRPANGLTPVTDDLLNTYTGQYRDQLRWHGMGDYIRAPGFTAYQASLKAAQLAAPNLYDLLNLDLDPQMDGVQSILDVQTSGYCLRHDGEPATSEPNMTRTGLDLARYLLTDGDAAHVFVVDAGLSNSASGVPYDTHSSGVSSKEHHVHHVSSNLFNTLANLAAHIDPNPDAPTSSMINLDDTLIVIHSEFGRSPSVEEGQGDDGRGHWPNGYVVIMIGGPIGAPVHSGIGGALIRPDSRLIRGGLNSNGEAPTHDSNASLVQHLDQADVKAAMLVAAGIDPFESDLFATSDIGLKINQDDEVPNIEALRDEFFGAA